MKNLLLGATLALTATTVLATPEGAQQYNARVLCAPTENWINYHAEFDIAPMLAGEKATLFDETGKPMDGTMVFWYNPETDTFSITFTPDINQDLTCVISYGEQIVEM